MIAKLGEFTSAINFENESDKFDGIQSIQNWAPLMHRYKPEFLPQIRKAIKSIQEYDSKLALPDWKNVLVDKKAGLVVWQRVTAEGLNAIKAQAVVE